MRALLLAAGLGTRLGPLTDYLPKCLVPIHGRPLLDYWMELLVTHGVEHVLVNTHHLAPLVSRFVSRSGWAKHITIVYEDQLLGTGGTILANREFLDGDSFMVAHADNLSIFDVSAFAAAHRSRPAGTDLTMMLFETQDPRTCGIVELDETGVVQRFHEKSPDAPGNLANAAVYMVEPSIIRILSAAGTAEIDLSTAVLPGMMGRIWTWRNASYHRDIGTVASWIQANRDFPVHSAATPDASAAWSDVLHSTGPGASVIAGLLSA